MSASYPRLARPEGFGEIGGRPIRQTDAPDVGVDSLASIRSHFANLPEMPALPDAVVFNQGPVSKELVGTLLAIAKGDESGYNYSPTDAINRLQALGMPVNAADWTPAQWDAQIAKQATVPSALQVLGY